MNIKAIILSLMICGAATAQNPYIAPLGANETSDGVVVAQPRSTLAVDPTPE